MLTVFPGLSTELLIQSKFLSKFNLVLTTPYQWLTKKGIVCGGDLNNENQGNTWEPLSEANVEKKSEEAQDRDSHPSGTTTMCARVYPLTGCVFLFNPQEEAARILAHQPVSVGTCAALKTPKLQWMCKRSCMTNSGFFFTHCFLFLMTLSFLIMGQMWCMPLMMRKLLMCPIFHTALSLACPCTLQRTLWNHFWKSFFFFCGCFEWLSLQCLLTVTKKESKIYFSCLLLFPPHLANTFSLFTILHGSEIILSSFNDHFSFSASLLCPTQPPRSVNFYCLLGEGEITTNGFCRRHEIQSLM